MLPQTGVKVILGTGQIGDASDPIVGFSTSEQTQELFNIFRANGGNEIDTARHYSPNAPGTSEPLIAKTDVKDWALISSKVKSAPGQHSKAIIEESVQESLDALQIPSLYIDYLHHPDPETPLEETVAAMDAAHRAGKLKRWGISNYSVEQVRGILAICDERNLVKPSVYQGQYNAIVRKAEDELLPLLRENGISFYAWGPAASGVFSGKSQRMTGTDTLSKIIQNTYDKPELKNALEKIHEHAEKAGITGHGIALRWILHHSALSAEHGDAIIVGARTLDQMSSTMEICGAGELPRDVVDTVEEVWDLIRDSAPDYLPAFVKSA